MSVRTAWLAHAPALGLIAALAAAPASSAGPCPGAGRIVGDVEFADPARVGWNPPESGVGHNIYFQDGLGPSPPAFGGRCLYAAFPESVTWLHGQPPPGGLWLFQVTALFAGGEGPLALAEDCTPIPPPAPCTCTLPAEVGPCDGVFPRWFHDYRTGACAQFIWGGCEGNANNFETETDCTAACLDPCTRPAEIGPCDALVPRWYFSALSGRCEEFTWGGCGGNANNFPDAASCRAACGP